MDSHEIFRKGVRYVLDGHPDAEVVGESGSIADGVREIALAGPDVAVVGIRENERDHLEALGPLRVSHPDVRLIVLTRTDDDETLAAAMRVGANGYLSKEVSAAQLVTAVQSVVRGHDVIDPERAKSLVRLHSGPEPVAGDPLAHLTSQERKILALIAEGLSNRQIAERLFLVEKTVRNHVTRLFSKLGVERRTQAALVATRLDGLRAHRD